MTTAFGVAAFVAVTATLLVFFVNGRQSFVYPRVAGVDKTQWPYDQPFYILIDQQLGGNWVGPVNTAQLPVDMQIDWVRIYQ